MGWNREKNYQSKLKLEVSKNTCFLYSYSHKMIQQYNIHNKYIKTKGQGLASIMLFHEALSVFNVRFEQALESFF